MNVTKFLRTAEGDRQESNLGKMIEDAMNQELASAELPTPSSPLSHVDPLHPAVAEHINNKQIEAAKKMAAEHVQSAQMMFDEAAARLEDAKKWAAGAVERATDAAIKNAFLHAKQRAAHAGMARVQAEYESEELPPLSDSTNSKDHHGEAVSSAISDVPSREEP